MGTRLGSTFQWEDYLVFGLMLAISSAIGIYFGFKNLRKSRHSSDEMLTGGRSLPMLPVALSLSASFTSATTILGIPAEVYARGGEQWLWIFGIIICFVVAAVWIVPVFHTLKLTNAYEYLEIRFNKVIRILGTVTFLIIISKFLNKRLFTDPFVVQACSVVSYRICPRDDILTYMAAVLYAPAVALSQVTGLSREISVLTMGLVCTFYTSIGGIRAVVWTDAFQLLVVWAGLISLMLKGASDVGGWAKVWKDADRGDRLPQWNMNPDPFIRHTFWTLLIGGGFNMLTVYGANQTNLQRYASVKSLKNARGALLLCLPLWVLYLTVLSLLGLVMYSYFLTCDPLTTGEVAKKDQLVPLFVLETMGQWPGLPGLFVAAIFSASISTVSSGVNSLAAVTLEDLVKPICESKGKNPTARALAFFTVILGILYGGLTIVLAYLADLLGKTALSISFSVFGMVGGPLLGVILNGIFLPMVNSWGAGAGLVVSLVSCLYIGIDPVFNPPPKSDLPFRTDGCASQTNLTYAANVTEQMSEFLTTTADYFNNSTESISDEDGGSSHLYVSYMHYATVGVLVSVIVGFLVSLCTGFNRHRVIDSRTVADYSCCSSSSNDGYDIKSDEGSFSHNNGNINYANPSVVGSDYVNHSSIKRSQTTHNNSVYANIDAKYS